MNHNRSLLKNTKTRIFSEADVGSPHAGGVDRTSDVSILHILDPES